MALLSIAITHLAPDLVHRQVAHLERMTPAEDIVVCHGGRREDFDAIRHPRKLFIEDPSLRARPVTIQSYNELLTRVWEDQMRDEPRWTAAVALEFDQVPLRPDFGAQLLRALELTGADFLGRSCVERNATNWNHYLRYRDDPGLLAFLRRISVRDDPTRMFGCLGTGFVLTREVMAAIAATEHYAPCFVELYLPTVVHHLGFRVGDLVRHSTMLDDVRWAPLYSFEQAVALKRRGAYFVHPFKEVDKLDALAAA
jgi:hypothetical protein